MDKPYKKLSSLVYSEERNQMNKRTLIAFLLLICSFTIFAYQLKYSESAKIKENLKDFRKVESFLSSKVSKTDIEKIDKKGKAYSFTIVNKEEVSDFVKLGKVFMVDKNEELTNSFILLKNGEEYAAYMRGVYMIIN